jgi:hypothetical protein
MDIPISSASIAQIVPNFIGKGDDRKEDGVKVRLKFEGGSGDFLLHPMFEDELSKLLDPKKVTGLRCSVETIWDEQQNVRTGKSEKGDWSMSNLVLVPQFIKSINFK